MVEVGGGVVGVYEKDEAHWQVYTRLDAGIARVGRSVEKKRTFKVGSQLSLNHSDKAPTNKICRRAAAPLA